MNDFSPLAFTVRFDHPTVDPRSTLNMVFVDTKTISFYSPPCPIQLTRDNPSCTIPIVVTQNNSELARINFIYQSSTCLSSMALISFLVFSFLVDYCLTCHSNKRSFADFTTNDNFPFNDVSVEPINNPETDLLEMRHFLTATRTIPPGNRLNLFEMLENAMNQGNIDFAWQLIGQATNILEQRNDRGETPLLIAARLNQQKLILSILSRRMDLATQIDHQSNNLLHLLANISTNRAKETIEKVFSLLDSRSKDRLISELNQSQERPADVAKNHGHNEYIDLLNHPVNFFDIH